MKKTIILLFTITIMLLTQACKEEEKYDDITYYDVIGEGYVFMYDTNNNISYPVESAEIIVRTKLDAPKDILGRSVTVKESYFTDATGKYKVRFIKRTYKSNAESCWFSQLNYYNYVVFYSSGVHWHLDIEEVKNTNNTIVLDTIKLYK